MNRKWILRIFSVFAAVLFVSAGGLRVAVAQQQVDQNVLNEAARGGYNLIDIDTLWSLYQSQEDLLLIDTRQEWEYYGGYIEGALNFPMEPTWLARMTQRGTLEQFLGPDKLKNLVFY